MASRLYKKRTPEISNKLDDTTIKIIKSLNGLIMEAQADNLIAIANVLEDARESIAWWAINDDFGHEPNETLAHQVKLSSGLNIAAVLMAKFAVIKDADIRKEMLELMQNFDG